MAVIICSACLLGVSCRHDGRSKPDRKAISLSKKETLIPVCPEQLGGMPTPRPDAEMAGGSGADVLDGKARVFDSDGKDVTAHFTSGAEECLRIARMSGASEAILKQRSPSCGSGKIYDGTFSKTVMNGDGVTAALLKRNGIKVITEEDL